MVNKREQAIILMEQHRYKDALPLFKQLLVHDTDDCDLFYMAGQCCRFQNDLKGAIYYLRRARAINTRDHHVLLALGIALQLNQNFYEAIESLRQAININPEYILAYNSLALTQKKIGSLDDALHNYEAGIKALSRSIVIKMNNSRENYIYKHRNFRQNLWAEYAGYGAMYLCSKTNDIDGIAWPTGEQAKEEEHTERHFGLYWSDLQMDDNKKTRYFLPNFFNTFRETLLGNSTYSTLIGNKGTVYQALGRKTEAQNHIEEAEDFYLME